MMPRVLIGEDMDAGLLGDGQSLMALWLRPLGVTWGSFAARQIMLVPDTFFLSAAVVILLRTSNRPAWHNFQQVLLIQLLYFCLFAFEAALPLLAELQPIVLYGISYLLILPIVITTYLADAVAGDEARWPLSAFVRSAQLVRRGPFRLLALYIVVNMLHMLCAHAEQVLLTAVPVIDASWFDWATTMFQECLSGLYLPFVSAITVAAFLHLRRRHDGDKPEETAAIFD
jgi:hypothetical protein